jgi:hypothetical protein
MTDYAEIKQRNEELARKINEETRRDPQSPYAGQFVGIANGQVVAVRDNLNELVPRLLEAEPDRRKVFVVEASRDYTKVFRV